jgi:uncharacterized protein
MVRAHHDRQRDLGESPFTSVVFHGGEPLVLPLPYFSAAIQHLQDELGDLIAAREAKIGVQTNLYRLTPQICELLRTRSISVGVSFDFVPGARLNVLGKESEADVRRNLNRLREEGIEFGAITVLAKHTAPHVCDIYDYFASERISWRLLPLFDGPESRQAESFAISHDELIQALERLFRHWMDTGAKVPVSPFSEHLENAVRKVIGLKGRLYDRATDGDRVFVVNLNGDLYRILDAYEEGLALGNVDRESLGELLASNAYHESLRRDEEHRQRYCSQCQYAGHCNGWPIFASRQSGDYKGRCPLSYRMHEFIEQYLLENGFDRPALLDMASELVASRDNASQMQIVM